MEHINRNMENITIIAKLQLLLAKLRFFIILLINFAFNLPFIKSEYNILN
jgi:hypothetical protein